MTDEWFNEYMFRLVVETKYVPAKVMELFKQKPVCLPADVYKRQDRVGLKWR